MPFELVEPTQAPDPFGPPAAGVGADAAVDSVAMKYYCALNFNVGGSIKKNTTVERVEQDGPVSPGAFQARRGGLLARTAALPARVVPLFALAGAARPQTLPVPRSARASATRWARRAPRLASSAQTAT